VNVNASSFKDSGTVFKFFKEKFVTMESRNENNKRRRKLIQREPVLVRSVKPGQASVQSWERKTSALSGLWNIGTSAA
jgi:hypothetical protein